MSNWLYNQSANAASGTTVELTGTVTAGDLLFFTCRTGSTCHVVSPDPAGNVWITLFNDTTNHIFAAYCLSAAAAVNLTITISATVNGLVLAEYTPPVNTSVVLDGSPGYVEGAVTESTTPVGGVLTTAGLNDLVLGMINNNNTNGLTISSDTATYSWAAIPANSIANGNTALQHILGAAAGNYAGNFNLSAAQVSTSIGTVAFSAVGTLNTPTFSPVAGTYSGTQTVTISSNGIGEAIHYTTDGSTPTSGSTLYSAPISVSTSETVKAIAILTGWTNSAVGSATYTISPAGVAWSPVDSRHAVFGFGPGANMGILDGQNNTIYSAQDPPFSGNSQVSDNSAIPPKDCRVAGAPTDSRVSKPVNSRRAPPF
jgi:Chitobiase/beta-hexosaminidase C-terminal domain